MVRSDLLHHCYIQFPTFARWQVCIVNAQEILSRPFLVFLFSNFHPCSYLGAIPFPGDKGESRLLGSWWI